MPENKVHCKKLLECELTVEEITAKGQELAMRSQEALRIEEEKKSKMSAFKAQIDACTAAIGTLALAVSTGKESREINCRMDYNTPTSGEKTLVRMDNGKKVEQSPMTRDEREDLFINGLGSMGTHFVFNDKGTAPLLDSLTDDKEKGWASVNDPMEAKEMVQEKRNPKEQYRVVFGALDGTTKYQLQIKEKAKGKAKAAK